LRAIFHPLAERELLEAIAFYNLESHGLGSLFLEEVERAPTFIADHPEAAVAVRGKIRRKLIRKFPYGVLYSVMPAGIRVLAIMTQKRRPFYWRERI